MKVLIVSFNYFPELGAAPTRLANLAAGLKEHGVEVNVLTCMPNHPYGRIYDGYRGKIRMTENVEGIKIYRYWGYASVSRKPLPRVWSMTSYGLILWLFAFRRKLIKTYDHIIVQTPPILVGYSAVKLFKGLFKRSTILNVSDIWPSTAVDMGAVRAGGLYHKFLCRVEKYIYSRADSVMGQSDEILDHIRSFTPDKQMFLYRNLQKNIPEGIRTRVGHKRNKVPRIVYAGLLGVAQNILGLLRNIDFKDLGMEFHIYGGGNQQNEVAAYAKGEINNIFYHGTLSKEQMSRELVLYDASIVPLTTPIKGAVPSKIFDLISLGVPVVFCGGGEGSEIIRRCSAGYISEPGDYNGLREILIKLKHIPDEEYGSLVNNCLQNSESEFSFERQMKKFIGFLEK